MLAIHSKMIKNSFWAEWWQRDNQTWTAATSRWY